MSTCFTIDRHSAPSNVQSQLVSRVSETLLEGSLCTVPSVASRDVKSLLADIRDREEQHFKQLLKVLVTDIKDRQDVYFRQLMEHQTEIQRQVGAMQSALKANSDSNAALQKVMTFATAESPMVSRESRNLSKASNASTKSTRSRAEQVQAAAKIIYSSAGTGETISPAEMSPKIGESDSQDFGNAGSAQNKFALRPSKTSLRLNKADSEKNEPEAEKGLRGRVARFLKCKEFEWAIAFSICVNALIMCWECQYNGLDVGFNLQYPGRQKPADLVWYHADVVFLVFDWLFGVLFLVEMLVKFVCFGRRYFYDSPLSDELLDERKTCLRPVRRLLRGLQGWNILDCSCVIAFFLDKSSSFLEAAINPQMIRLLRLFRIFRMVRLVRYLESLDHLYIMVTALAGVRNVLVWAIVLITTILLTCDLFLVQILHATYFDKVTASELTEEQLKRHHDMYEYFGTCTRCMLSMFEITLGNWPPVARLLSEEASEWFTLFCLIHKLTIGFAVISVISGVILQETFKVAQTDDIIMFRQKKMASAVLHKKLKALFHELDVSGDGCLEMSEVEALSDLPEIKTWLGSLGIETDDVKTLFELIDENGDGVITLEEMISRMPRLQGGARSIDVLAMQRKLYPKPQEPDRVFNKSPSMETQAGPRSEYRKELSPEYLLTEPEQKSKGTAKQQVDSRSHQIVEVASSSNAPVDN